ncbi:hypothetical protein GQ43DRAFT_400335 [Delitschia confertaspora ATCC 74209]|uniref:Ribosome biogenesis protein SLX9 n=1 Tax=Delitschia confertaspora ATCC 74209 TaxID=1513339 RepID=A0A9P4MT50_9PLEO|nr:hypothetical protein GQ43DRAFT_400335 [Delitschia confertaspora ATCC 74209]
MAPIQKKRVTARSKAARAVNPLKPQATTSSATGVTDSALHSTKRDKRTMKHSAFVNKVEKSNTKTTKRRRPNKQLAANLESLADALPDLDFDDEAKSEVVVGQATITRKSLKSRPGAMKKKEKLEKAEKDRFNQNLAQMAVANTGTTSIADRWVALKNHVQSTAEKKAEFVKS